MANIDTPTYQTIQAAVNGEAWAVEKVVDSYGSEIDELATVKQRQPDGSIKPVIDEDLRQALVLKLIEAIPQFSLESEGDTHGNKKP